MRRLKRWLRAWWECRTKRCSYYEHYLVYGGPELVHEGFHAAERKAGLHFKNCSYSGPDLCRVCSAWELRLRA